MEEFKKGDEVLVNEDGNPQGPFLVLRTKKIPSNLREHSLHSQWVTIEKNGKKVEYGGWFLTLAEKNGKT